MKINISKPKKNVSIYFHRLYVLRTTISIRINFCFIKCIDWHRFGFKERNAKDSTLWLGSKFAYTPCHYDTYGYNLVAQIYGR